MLSVETEGKLWSLGQAVAKPARLEPVMVTFVTAAEAPAAPAIVATHPRPGSGVAVDKPGRRDGNEQTLSRRRRSGVRDVADHVDDQLHGSGIEEMDSAIGVERHDGLVGAGVTERKSPSCPPSRPLCVRRGYRHWPPCDP